MAPRRATLTTPAKAPPRLLRHWPAWCLVALVVLSGLVDLWWLHSFRAGFPLDIDESRYIALGLAFKDNLSSGGPVALWHAWEAQREFGPLLPLTSVPLYALLGESLRAAFATQLVFFAVLVLASYGVGARLTSRAGGVLTALVVAGTPAVIDFTRSYQFPITAAAMLTAATYALMASQGMSRRGWAIGWGVLLGLMALSRTMMLAFVPALLLAAAWLALASPRLRRARIVNLALGALAALLTALTWFASSWSSVAHYLLQFGYGSQSAHFGTARSPLSVGFWTRQVVDTARAELYLPLALLLAAAIALGLGVLVARLRHQRADGRLRACAARLARSEAIVVLLVVLEGYLALTSSSNDGVGFRLPLIPGLVAVAVLAIWRLPWRHVRTALVVGLIVTSALNVVMKADVSSAVSRAVTLDVPAVGTVPVLDGQGYIQGYVAAATGAASSLGTRSLARSQRGWLPAYDTIAVDIHGLLQRRGVVPNVRLAAFEPLLNPNNLALATRRRFHEDLLVGGLQPPAHPSLASYRRLLSQSPAPNVLVAVRPFALGFYGPTIDQRLIERAARSLGFRRSATVQLPDGRRAVIFLRLPRGA